MAVFAIAAAVLLVGSYMQPEPVAAATDAQRVMNFAKNQIGKPYKWGRTGLRRYDCSGLIYRTFKEKGLLKKIGGRRATARWYFRWFRDRGLVTRNPKKGDLVAWGKPVSHVGIFAGYNRHGKPMAISALYKGVSKHKVHAMNAPLKAYLRVKIQR